MVLTFESVDKILWSDHSNENLVYHWECSDLFFGAASVAEYKNISLTIFLTVNKRWWKRITFIVRCYDSCCEFLHELLIISEAISSNLNSVFVFKMYATSIFTDVLNTPNHWKRPLILHVMLRIWEPEEIEIHNKQTLFIGFKPYPIQSMLYS